MQACLRLHLSPLGGSTLTEATEHGMAVAIRGHTVIVGATDTAFLLLLAKRRLTQPGGSPVRTTRGLWATTGAPPTGRLMAEALHGAQIAVAEAGGRQRASAAVVIYIMFGSKTTT